MKKISLGLVSILSILILTACSSKSNDTNNSNKNKLSIVTTFYPVYDFTKNIVGQEGDVKLLIPSGSEPHDYEPSAKETKEIEDSDIFIYHNENLETWVPSLEKNLDDKKVKIIKATKDLKLMEGHTECESGHNHNDEETTEDTHHHHELDPHTWLSPKMAIKEVESITKQLDNLYPDKSHVFDKNSKAYIEKLKGLDNDYTSSLSKSKQNNTFVTQHSAFGYLARDYNLNQVSVSGLNPDEEPSAKTLKEIKDYVKEEKLQYIYFEHNANSKIAETLANEANVKTEILNPLESLTDQQIDNGEDYISVMRDNLVALEKTIK